MVGWNSSFDWSYEEYKKVVGNAFLKDDVVVLDTEHSSYLNEREIVTWAKK